MHRPGWYRALLALWGLWFTTALTEPAGIMACAMHGALPGGEHGALAGAAAHRGHGDGEQSTSAAIARNSQDDASHAAHEAHAETAAVDAQAARGGGSVIEGDAGPSNDSHECCTCIGQCCAATNAVPPAPSIALPTVAVRAEPARDFSRRERVPSPRAYVLPFANAPPAADA